MECPITLCKIKTPVIAADGYVYEAQAAARWFEKNKTSPITGLVLESTILYPFYTNINYYEQKDDTVIEENQHLLPVDAHLKEIIKEQKERLIIFEQERNSMRGVIKHMIEYDPINEERLNTAKKVNDSTARTIQHYVQAIIESYSNENSLKALRCNLNDILKKENIIQFPSDNPLNFSCLPLRNMEIIGNGRTFNFQCSDMRNVKFYGDTTTGGCIHGNYSWADISGSICINDFCTKQSIYRGTCMQNTVLTGCNTGCNNYDGAITIGTKIRENNKLNTFTWDNTISLQEHLLQLNELKKKFKK